MKRMLFNATQQEELRVAIVDGQRLLDIDIETTGREQHKSNIYKAVITRIEPSLEACFVNYGEDRHGFLPFKEVSRAYFQNVPNIRNTNIKEALREGQELTVQVEKEERGNKGAALTTFISLAGRYLVLMPNNPRGGGVSRRVEGEERQELREALDQLDIPQGMSVIARTAGIGRSIEELQWDLNYQLQIWRAIEGAVSTENAGTLIYHESSLVIRAIRDYFQPDIGEILIDTKEIYDQVRSFVELIMPDMANRVKLYTDQIPLFSRFQIEHQIESAYSRVVPLPSGGSIVIDHTEALVAIDVNSARSTRGTDIETTAFNTNCEAAEEAARQLRLRDLGGLIVIDFIDMENTRNQRELEDRLKEALRYDRARVQMGKISRFGLMELSRQRLRPALSEGSHITCPRCNGTGHVRDTESSALQILRIIEEEAMKENTAMIHVQMPVDVAAFLLNEKRGEVLKTEMRHQVNILVIPNKYLETPHYKLERIKQDDPRLEDTPVSYTLAESEDVDQNFQKRQKEPQKPKQEAVIKSVTPEESAPVSNTAEDKKEQPKEEGFFSRILNLFRSTPEEKTEQKPKTRADGTRKRTRRGGRNRTRSQDNHSEDKNVQERNSNREDLVSFENVNKNNFTEKKEERKPVQRRKTPEKIESESVFDDVPLSALPYSDFPQTTEVTDENHEQTEQTETKRRRRQSRSRRGYNRVQANDENNSEQLQDIAAPVFVTESDDDVNSEQPQNNPETDVPNISEDVASSINQTIDKANEAEKTQEAAQKKEKEEHVYFYTPPQESDQEDESVSVLVSENYASYDIGKLYLDEIESYSKSSKDKIRRENKLLSEEKSSNNRINEETKPTDMNPSQAGKLNLNSIDNMLASAGLMLAETDPEKLREAQNAQQEEKPQLGRPRKAVQPISDEPLIQVNTNKE